MRAKVTQPSEYCPRGTTLVKKLLKADGIVKNPVIVAKVEIAS